MMHVFVINIGGFTGPELARLDTLAAENGITRGDQQWTTPDRKRAAIFAFALVGLGAAYRYHQQKEASSGQEGSEVPRS